MGTTIDSMLSPLFYSTPDFRAALRLVWVAGALGTACASAACFVLPEETIARIVPQCESKRLYGRECVLCGTTTGFIAIARGDLRGAADGNRLALALFAAFFFT